MKEDVSIVRWQPLPVPKERFVLVRYREDVGRPTEYQGSCLAWSDELQQLRNSDPERDYVLRMAINAWAYLPYDPDLDDEN